MIEIVVARSAAELQQVRELSRGYVAWLVEMDTSLGVYDPDVFRAYGYEGGEARLPGEYAAPDGCLLLASVDARPAGCVALRRLDESTCELRMLFVDPAFQGMGVGRALVDALLDEARTMGYSTVRLDTVREMASAYRLYQALGFREVEQAHDRQDSLSDLRIVMERPLAQGDGDRGD